MTGSALITAERQRQILKHSYTPIHDAQYTNGQLGEAAIYAINGDYETYPIDWDEKYRNSIAGVGKSYIERLAVAGALIAAEIDRILLIQNANVY